MSDGQLIDDLRTLFWGLIPQKPEITFSWEDRGKIENIHKGTGSPPALDLVGTERVADFPFVLIY